MDYPGEKLVLRLWETLAEKGIGSILQPWHMLRTGKAAIEVRRQEVLMLAQAEVDAAAIREGKMRFLNDGSTRRIQPAHAADTILREARVEPRLDFESIAQRSILENEKDIVRAEINTAASIAFAEEVLSKNPSDPPGETVDRDWLYRWRAHAGMVSTEDLQRLWGNVLAGEVASPGSYSIRAMELLKTISRSEAELISKIAGFVIEDRVIRMDECLKSAGITFNSFLELQELGIVAGVEAMGMSTKFESLKPESYLKLLRCGNKGLVVENEDPKKELSLEVYLITRAGKQIIKLCDAMPNAEYLEKVGMRIAEIGFSVQLVNWWPADNNMLSYKTLKVIDGSTSQEITA